MTFSRNLKYETNKHENKLILVFTNFFFNFFFWGGAKKTEIVLNYHFIPKDEIKKLNLVLTYFIAKHIQMVLTPYEVLTICNNFQLSYVLCFKIEST